MITAADFTDFLSIKTKEAAAEGCNIMLYQLIENYLKEHGVKGDVYCGLDKTRGKSIFPLLIDNYRVADILCHVHVNTLYGWDSAVITYDNFEVEIACGCDTIEAAYKQLVKEAKNRQEEENKRIDDIISKINISAKALGMDTDEFIIFCDTVEKNKKDIAKRLWEENK